MNHSGKNAGTIVAVASSTGGPKALQVLLSAFPKDFPYPIVVVQHMPAGFTQVMAKRLDDVCALPVKEGEENEEVRPGVVYIAKGGLHLTIERLLCGKHVIRYLDAPFREGVKPCANYMFESLADCRYERAICVVLTGMGSDGTEGIKKLKNKKTCYCIAQDQKSSTIYGMPKRVYEAGITDIVLPLDEIAEQIMKMRG